MEEISQPHAVLNVDGNEVVLLGTAHVSKSSAQAVADLINQRGFDARVIVHA